MRSRVLLTLVAIVFAVLLAPSITEAQTKFSGKQQCAKPNPEYSVPVADQANHVMMLAGQKCTWTQGEVGGDKFKDEDDVIAMDVVGNQSRDRGYGAGTMASGRQVQHPIRWHHHTQGQGSRGCAVHVGVHRRHWQAEGHYRERHLQGDVQARRDSDVRY